MHPILYVEGCLATTDSIWNSIGRLIFLFVYISLPCAVRTRKLGATSSVECYMNQHGVSEEETNDEFNEQVINTRKDMNEVCLSE